MRKSMKRIITLCLALVMLASVMSVSSFAASKSYGVYSSFGDSIPSGYGLPSYSGSYPPNNVSEAKEYNYSVRDTYDTGIVISGCYPSLVSKEINATTTNYYAKSGYRTVELRALLDDSENSYERTAFDQYMLFAATSNSSAEVIASVKEACDKATAANSNVVDNAALKAFNDKFEAQKDNYRKAVKDADVITLNFGSNDTFSYGMYHIETSNWISEMSAGAYEGYNRFKENFDEIIKIIRELNPTAEIYVVGMYNPFRGATLTDTSYVQLGNLADSVVGLVNSYMMYYSKYTSQYTYVNVSETESWGFETVSDMLGFTDSEKMWEFVVKIHPTYEGHQYICNQIVKAMNGKSTATGIGEALGNRIDAANDKTASNLDKINNGINDTNSSVKSKTNSWLEQIKGIINGSGSNATPAGDDVTALGDVSFNTTDHNAYVKGYADGSFGPEKSITRAETAQMLYNLLSAETVEKYGSNNAAAKFSDVNASAWYNVAVSTLVSTGAINGYSDNTFKPDKQITRAEFVKMVMSIAGISSSATPSFSDTATNAWYSLAVGTAQKAGFIEGSGGAFRPNANMTRAEAVTFMNRVLGRAADTAYIGNHLNTVKSFTDVSVNAWYYKAVMEAANGHTYSVANNTETWTSVK